MNRKIQTSCGKRKFYHQNQNNNNQFVQNNNIIRPPTSLTYSCLNNYRSSAKIRNQYESNYFTGKIFVQRKNQKNQQQVQRLFTKSKVTIMDQEDIPRSFKLLLSQIKILLKNSICQQDQFKQILKNLTKKIKQLYSQNTHLTKQLKQKTKTIQQNKQSIQKLTKKIKQLNENNKFTHNKLQKQMALIGNIRTQKSQFQIMIQNLHLIQLNQSYINTIKQLQNKIYKQNIQIKKDYRQSQSNTDYLRLHNRINYLQMKVTNAENIQNQLTQENQLYTQNIQNLNQNIIKFKEQTRKYTQQKNQWRQRALMQKQDSQTNCGRQNFLLFSIKKLRQINKNLTDKILNINSQEGARKIKQLQPNPYFQYQIDFFKSLKSVYFEAKFKQYKMSLQNKKDSFQIQAIGLEQQYVEYRKHEQVNLVGLNYYRPTFFSFIQQCITNDIYTCRVKGSTSVSRIFIQVLRAIMNFGCQQKFSRFPQFVYSWFQKFYFNSQKSQVSALEPYMQKPISQDLFYRDLMNVKLDQSWQIITFRQFLLEQLNLQQLYFYLMCQNLLYKRAGVNDQIQYLGEFCIFVEFSAAKSVLDLVLSDFESWNVSFLTSKLRQKIIIKKNIQYIESGFFLRCLIQYYKIQRINRYKYISKLCDQFKSCQQNGLRFSSFVSVINRFTQISSQQKIRIYRDCYSVGKGKITSDIIFTVCTEQLVFLRYLKLKCFFKLPTLICYKQLKKNKKKVQQEQSTKVVTKKPMICVQPSDSYIYQIFISLNKLINNQNNFSQRIQKLGVSQILHHFEIIKKMLSQRSSSIDSSILKCRHFIHFISITMHKIRELSFQNFYDLLEQNNKKKGDSSFWIEISQVQLCEIFTEQFKVTFDVFQKINNFRLWKQQVYNFRVNNAARKIQRQVRKKFIQPFMQLYKIIYSQLKKDDKDTKSKQKPAIK